MGGFLFGCALGLCSFGTMATDAAPPEGKLHYVLVGPCRLTVSAILFVVAFISGLKFGLTWDDGAASSVAIVAMMFVLLICTVLIFFWVMMGVRMETTASKEQISSSEESSVDSSE